MSIVVVVRSANLSVDQVQIVAAKTRENDFVTLEYATGMRFPQIWKRLVKPERLYSTSQLKESSDRKSMSPLFWTLSDPDQRRLVSTIHLISTEVGVPYEIFATPYGEDPQYEETVTVDEIEALVHSERLRNDTMYVVTPN